MAFNKEIKTKALVSAARHCCVCHRYKGVKVEVHHIVPIFKGGTDTEDNAIALCFDCHADAGHYNSKHPRGIKFSPEELRYARDVWYSNVKQKRIDITDDEEWRAFQVVGSSFHLKSGIASTVREPNGCPDSWFSGDSTLILGSGEVQEKNNSKTVALWKITLTPYWRHHFEKGFLVVGCLRYFGGLHSKLYGAQVEIIFNRTPIDGFGLMIIPENHTDYFHRIPAPQQLPNIWPLSACQTTYAWPIRNVNLSSTDVQTITIEIDKDVSWDIDYVAIVCQAKVLPKRVFISHNWKDKEVARQIAKDLTARGIGVWLDEAEIRLGDSLIEKIREGIDNVEYLLVLLSSASVDSQWVRKEVDTAMNQEIEGKRVKVLPVLLDECDLPGFLKGKFYADLKTMTNYDTVLNLIEERMRP